VPNANRDKGIRAEKAIAAYFREHGAVDVERSVRAGWRNSARSSADQGDHIGLHGICIQAKDYTGGRGPLVDKLLEQAMAETLAQCVAAKQIVPLLIEKRKQCADVGKWYAWLPANTYCVLITGMNQSTWDIVTHPVRVELRYIIDGLVGLSNARKQAKGA
jgi:hypothetical protein